MNRKVEKATSAALNLSKAEDTFAPTDSKFQPTAPYEKLDIKWRSSPKGNYNIFIDNETFELCLKMNFFRN